MIEGVSVYWAHPLFDYWFLGDRYILRSRKREKRRQVVNG